MIRLNKVTRDLNVGIATVVDFLSKKGYTVDANPNAKISEEQYAALVKEFSNDKDMKIESGKIIQERQGKDRNKATVSNEVSKANKPDEEMIETRVPEDVRPKFKQVGKIDLDSLKRRKKSKPTETNDVPQEPEQKLKEEPATQALFSRRLFDCCSVRWRISLV